MRIVWLCFGVLVLHYRILLPAIGMSRAVASEIRLKMHNARGIWPVSREQASLPRYVLRNLQEYGRVVEQSLR